MLDPETLPNDDEDGDLRGIFHPTREGHGVYQQVLKDLLRAPFVDRPGSGTGSAPAWSATVLANPSS